MNDEPIYPDTNFYMDHFEGRVDKLRPLGEFAYNLLRKSVECEYKIIISSLVIDELEFNGLGDKIKELIGDLKDVHKLIYAEETENDEKKARQLRQKLKTSLNDTKHAVIANRMKAKFLVTRNMDDFKKLQHLVELKYPENL